MRYALAAAIAALISLPVSAQAQTTENGFSGTGELGLAIARGNTDNRTLIAKLTGEMTQDQWRHTLGTNLLYGEADGVQNARRWEVLGASAYQINDRSSLIGSARKERDNFGAYEYQAVAAVNYGFQAINTDTTKLALSAGPGYRWAKVQGLRIHENEAVLRGAVDFRHAFNESTSIYNNLTIEAGRDNTFARNDIGLLVRMSESLALKAGLEVRHNTDVLPDTKRTDTLTTVNVVYGF